MTELLKAMQEMMETQVGSLASWMEAKTDAHLKEIRADQELVKDEMLAKMGSQLEKMEACLGKTEVTDFEANPEEIVCESEHVEVPKEETAVETYGALKKAWGQHSSRKAPW
jgi:hypothetical protein